MHRVNKKHNAPRNNLFVNSMEVFATDCLPPITASYVYASIIISQSVVLTHTHIRPVPLMEECSKNVSSYIWMGWKLTKLRSVQFKFAWLMERSAIHADTHRTLCPTMNWNRFHNHFGESWFVFLLTLLCLGVVLRVSVSFTSTVNYVAIHIAQHFEISADVAFQGRIFQTSPKAVKRRSSARLFVRVFS